MGFRTFTTVGELLWYYCSPVCRSPTQRVWDLILSGLCSSYNLTVAYSLSLDMRYIFSDRFQYPVDGSTASCDFSAFTGGDAHMSFYSAILNQKPQAMYFKYLCIDRGVEGLGIQYITSSHTLLTHTTQSCAPFNNRDYKKVV